MNTIRNGFFFLLLIILCLFSCNSRENGLKEFELEQGYSIETVTGESMIESPVSLVIDDKGIGWVVEMKGYMSDIDGLNENIPDGRIKKLIDLDNDGRFDKSEIFLDSLVIPRSVLPVYDGVLVALPPDLWFYDAEGNNRILVDSSYALGGNAEHQANGLLRGIDNWIYSAKSDKRYKRENGQWKWESTKFRGQWGLDQDQYGRLYYNHNSVVILSEVLPPDMINFEVKNYYPGIKKIVPELSENPRINSKIKNIGVNRAYEEGVLDSNDRLIYCTSCCGVSVNESSALGSSFNGSIFVAETAANVIKRVKLVQNNLGQQEITDPYLNSEFLRSDNELFRPVFTTIGNDGMLYIVDMRKGVVQHVTYLTNYLRRYISGKGLDTINNFGKIYRITPTKNNNLKNVNVFNKTSKELISLLEHDNRKIRIDAHWKLLNSLDKSMYTDLMELFSKTKKAYTKIHILHILKEVKGLNSSVISAGISDKNIHVKRHSVSLSTDFTDKIVFDFKKSDSLTQLIFITSMAGINDSIYLAKNQNYMDFLKSVANDSLYAAVFAAEANSRNKKLRNELLNNKELPESLLKQFLRSEPNKSKTEDMALNHLSGGQKDAYFDGKRMYEKLCSGCHHPDGEGIPTLAPPLAGSSVVNHQDISVTVKTLLYGIPPKEGTNKKYGASMTGLIDNDEVNNGNIAAIITYIRNSWGNKSRPVTLEEVSSIRKSGQ
jgi:hypothetical protein